MLLRLGPRGGQGLVLTLLLILCYGYFRQVPAWNEYSRYDLVLALVDDHTTRIDPYHENTGDKAFYNGHYYSDKAPGSALLALPTYALMRAVSELAGRSVLDPAMVMHALTWTASGIPTVLLAFLLLRVLRSLVDDWWALTLTLAYALGTIAFPFATMFFGHAASSFFLFAAFYMLWSARANPSRLRALVAGFLAGWAVLTEFPVALGVALLATYSFVLGRKTPLLFLAGGLFPLAILLAYNWAAFDHPLRLGYQYATVFGELNSQGLIGIVLPKLSTTGELLLGPRGLLRLSPWLSLAPLGLWAARRQRIRAETILCGAIVAAFLTYNSGYLNPFGGWTPGPRYLIPALPFATILVALAPRAFRPLLGLQIAYAVIVATIATTTMPNAPEFVHDPLGDLWLPRLRGRDLAETTAWLRWGLHGAQPLVLLGFAMVVAVATLYASAGVAPVWRWMSSLLAGILAALVLHLGTPFGLPWPGPVGAATTPGSMPSEAHIAVVDAGVTHLPPENEKRAVAPWAQLENRGSSADDTTVVFAIYDSSGNEVWSAWHGAVAWSERERKRLGVEWDTADVAPGAYRLTVSVVSDDQQRVFTTAENVARVQVRP